MLRSLDIRDMLIIDRLELDFQPGLNVLTGETGAGKSILLDALGFVLGWRGRAELVREGAEQGEVVAVFDLDADHPAARILGEAGLPVADELILRRVNSRDGRKTAWVNDRRASGEVLRALSDTLVELHGQHDDRGLLDPKGHGRVLDDFAGSDALLGKCRKAWSDLAAARAAFREQQKAVAELTAEEEFLRHAVAEIETLAPEPGEDAKLDQTRRLMQAGERVREDLGKAMQAMGGEDGAEGRLNDALRWTEDAAALVPDRTKPTVDLLERCLSDLSDAQRELGDVLDALAFNPTELEEVEERLFALRGLARKHGVLPDDLAGLGQDLAVRLAALDASGDTLAACAAAVEVAQAQFDAAAQALSQARAKAAGRLDAAMTRELAPLKMERAVFSTRITEAAAGPDGCDAVQFVVATNPGTPAGPLNKIASGGELSRFLLALKVCLTGQTPGLTMIFDEIDRGVGGATADAVGRRLAGIAADAQVLVVTHSPQVAALGNHHWRVEKTVKGETTRSTVAALDPAARIDEIARMLAGDTVTNEARAAAAALLGAGERAVS